MSTRPRFHALKPSTIPTLNKISTPLATNALAIVNVPAAIGRNFFVLCIRSSLTSETSFIRYVAALIAINAIAEIAVFTSTSRPRRSPEAKGTVNTKRFFIHCFGRQAITRNFNVGFHIQLMRQSWDRLMRPLRSAHSLLREY